MSSPAIEASRWQAARLKAARFHEVAKFGAVGGACYVIDVLIFNVFHVVVGTGPLTAKTISTVIAGTCAYVGNRHWSFTHRARTGVRREYSLFIALNGIGLGIALACLGFTRYVLGLDSTLAVNISGNIVGTGLGTIFRFWAYKRWVFLHLDHPRVTEALDATEAVAIADLEARQAGAVHPNDVHPNGTASSNGTASPNGTHTGSTHRPAAVSAPATRR